MNNWNHLNCPNFRELRLTLRRLFIDQSHRVHTANWQGVPVANDPSAVTHELLNVGFTIDLKGIESLPHWQFDIQPNLPWADNHFAERVCGAPINPGIEWANWPDGGNAAKFLDDEGKFNHNYMQRYWPKNANAFSPATKTKEEWEALLPKIDNFGIGGEYGDLDNVVGLLLDDPLTRQAWLPIFFPEDTGNANPGRKPCTLGYQFIVRENRLHIYYPLRSCDFARHFNDDIYLTIRLGIWVLEQCRQRGQTTFWDNVELGSYTMHCTSLHLFANDMIALKKEFGEL